MVTSTGHLEETHQQSSLGLSLTPTSVRDARARPKAGFQLNVQKHSIIEFGGISFVNTYLNIKPDSCQGGRKSAGMHLQVPLTLRGRAANKDSNLITIIFICCGGWYTSKFLDQWRSITTKRFVILCFIFYRT